MALLECPGSFSPAEDFSYADASLYGGDDDVHHGHGAEFSCRSAHQPGHDRSGSGRQHHGLHSHGKHHAVCHVHVARESNGRGGHSSRDGRADTDALYPHDGSPVDAGSADGSARGYANARQHVDADVHVGGSDQLYYAGRVHGDGALGRVGYHFMAVFTTGEVRNAANSTNAWSRAFNASPWTPGPRGHNDAADPETPDSFVGDTPGPLGGGGDFADPTRGQVGLRDRFRLRETV